MSCAVCKSAFVSVARFLEQVRKEPLSPEMMAEARKLAAVVVMCGYSIIDTEIAQLREKRHADR